LILLLSIAEMAPIGAIHPQPCTLVRTRRDYFARPR